MKRRSLIVRIWRDETGQLCGQISNPLTGQRQLFTNAADLWNILAHSLAGEPTQQPSQKDND